ncbi:erythrocyte membrane protein 1 [Plasmodium falciparum IGH-CR14]|uniref:Erythrocyte membrane protein 1 n=1 Tax=Plasmodium falciparum IGH-CR14 TaxID=580059 RepID=A0A0L1I7P2_PLAFA|nr:erythrocyte membrane protein 1 [Plasmodium falciparum IGH-CR14]
MVPQSRSGGGKDDYSDAKDFLDQIGQQVYDEIVKKDDEAYKEALKGDLKKAKVMGKTASTTDPCDLIKDKVEELLGTNSNRYPCKELSGKMLENPFSDTLGGQCTDSKMRSDGIGACAPYRRLHLCHHNLESISDYDSNAKHKLLLEVCLAAKHEGNSINTHYSKHKHTNNDCAAELCTVLARSFADIGDIVRGRDLYLGNTQEKDQRKKLDDKLKDIFKKIHSEVTSSGNNKEVLKTRYNGDEANNFFKLREDWWTANRETVWKAITCHAGQSAQYFRLTCGGEENKSTLAKNNCRCAGKNADQVPTYFDYVPQYLRWFEEWAEDFCRLRKHKLKDAIDKCRRPKGEHKYCDLNRHDCARTIRGNHVFVEEDNCKYCHFSCSHFVKWIDNQKLEFLKQKKKYKTEISGGGSGRSRQKRGARSNNNYEEYEKKFYKELQDTNYKNVEDFLKKLSNEKICQKKIQVRDETADNVDFTKGKAKETFDHTEYCQACPWCGVKEQKAKGGKWEPKTETCGEGRGYSDYENTKIPILTGDKTKSDMVKKYNKFCKNNGGNGAPGATPNATSGEKGKKGDQMEKWICYYGENKGNMYVKGAINFCVLQDGNQDWRNELGSCINNNTNDNTCKNNKCNSDCDCFLKWVKQKEKEWQLILKHFKKQGGFDKGERQGYGLTQEYVLAALLDKDLLLKSIEDIHADAKDIDRIKKMLKDEETSGASSVSGTGGANGKNSIIHKLLKHEEEIATKCKNCQPTKIRNPCSGNTSDANATYPVVAHKVAADIHKKAHMDMLQRSGKVGESETDQKVSLLKADASQGHYNGNGNVKNLNGEICSIDEKYSNAGNDESKNPCNGKGDGLQIGDTWNVQNSKSSTFGVHIRPRRKHMCTSNLEKLDYSWVIQNANDHVNDTFLVDVLLAAKKEAEYIKKKYNEKQNDGKNGLEDDQVTTCRAIKSSFADIGDIIRGRDLWVNGDSSTDIKNKLEKIFPKIKEELKNKLSGEDKYTNDLEHKQLRADWWEANRETVWDAMKCKKNGVDITCDSDVPFDDYIPQRLRWMTEWAEWFCKEQYSLYDKLLQKCGGCMGKGQGDGEGCTQKTQECDECKKACDKYKTNINKWKKQWEQISGKYLMLYWQAENPHRGTVFDDDDPDYHQMLDFFEQLQEKYKTATRSSSTTNSPYATPAGYIHQEARTGQCLEQNEFCEYKNGVTPTTGAKEVNEKYAFKHPPHGYDKACKCDTRDQQTDRGGPVARSDPSSPPAGRSEVEEEEEEEEEEDEDEDEEKSEAENTQDTEGDGSTTTTKVEGKAACQIVDDLFKDTNNFSDACTLKYGPKAPTSWKCVPTEKTNAATSEGSSVNGDRSPRRVRSADSVDTTTTKPGESGDRSGRNRRDTEGAETTTPSAKSDASGSICIPPRRRKLYIKKIVDWAEKQSSQPQTGGGSESPSEGKTTSESSDKDPQVALLEAFVKSAAVETFFLWDRYKKEWEAQKLAEKGQNELLGALASSLDFGTDNDNPQNKLQESGEIPDDFLRQMFYTLGDYRDICVGNTGIVINASSDDKKSMETIEKKIEEILPKNGDKNPLQNGDTSPQNSDKRQTLWSKYAEPIWNGMICALTYEEKTSSASGSESKIEQNSDLKEKLWDSDKKQPKETRYQYKTVVLKEEDSDTSPKPQTGSPGTSGEKTTLVDFISRPPYFRYLEEWGETFCRERTRRLEDIKSNCLDGDGTTKQKYSGDGEQCDRRDTSNGLFAELDKPSCATPCRLYKKWIERKRTEYEKQKSAYEQQKEQCKKESNNHYNGFYGTLKSLSDAAEFLQKLGPCKNENGEDKKGDLYIKFDEDKSFKHTEYCDSCSEFIVKCENGVCSGGGKKVNCNGKNKNSITAKDIGNGGNSAEDIGMLVSDNSGNGFNGDLSDCKDADIFKGFRKDVWTCRNVCGLNVCGLKKGDNNGELDDKQIILVRALIKRWLETFFEDYNRIQKKLKACTKSGKGCKCIKGCVDEWITKKKAEWKTIKERYVDNYEKENEHGNNLNSFLEQAPFKNEVDKAIKPCTEFNDFQKSKKCTETDSSENENGKGSNKKDGVVCLLENLKKEIEQCNSMENSGENQTQAKCEEYTPPDDEEPLEETEENQVEAPNICPTPTQPKQEEEGDKCEPAATPSDDQIDQTSNPEQTHVLKPEEKAPAPEASKPETPVKPAQPLPSDEPSKPISDILSSTIPFGIAIALTSIVFLFLKKKTKASVGNLFQILQIPKGDYDIPTKLSPNRYIPYTSGKYRGKRYIYLEGDSGTDSGYTDHYSDITSSSESEYEELDINDIYVPRAPKYKTLIEVVLEPSGKNTTASGNNTTASDTQNDIQNDGIPSSKITDNEWNQLKHEFISNMLQNQPNDVPNDYKSGNSPTNTNITTTSRDNVDNNTHPTMSRDNMEEKPFIMSIHDRNLLSGEEYNYDTSTNSGNNNLYSGENNVYGGIDPTSDNRGLTSGKHDSYSGIDLINDSLSGDYDIYDEVLKRKENELFGTNHVKQTSIHSVAKLTNSDDPIHNQLDLFHTWLDRHRDMCEKWKNNHERLPKLKELWENETHSGNTHPSDSNKTLNTDVSIQIDMDNPKPINQFNNMYTILEDLEKYNEPYYYDMYDDDIYYDVNDHDTSTVDSNNMDVPSKVQIEMDVNTKLVKEKYPIADVWDI